MVSALAIDGSTWGKEIHVLNIATVNRSKLSFRVRIED